MRISILVYIFIILLVALIIDNKVIVLLCFSDYETTHDKRAGATELR